MQHPDPQSQPELQQQQEQLKQDKKAMASSTLTIQNPNGYPSSSKEKNLDEVSAAEALLRVSPYTSPSSTKKHTPTIISGGFAGLESLAEQANALPSVQTTSSQSTPLLNDQASTITKSEPLLSTGVGSSIFSAGGGLDALAMLASEAQPHTTSSTAVHSSLLDSVGTRTATSYCDDLDPHLVSSCITSRASPTCSSSEDEDFDSMPPPLPRGRPRSASNPEGMEKWDSYNRYNRASRRHFVLPESILEEELAEASAAIQQQKRLRQLQQQEQQQKQLALLQPTKTASESRITGGRGRQNVCNSKNNSNKKKNTSSQQIGTSPDSVVEFPSSLVGKALKTTFENQPLSSSSSLENEAQVPAPPPTTAATKEAVEVGDTELTPEELLKRARSRLLEDLSEGNMNGEKGVLTLPHSLAKYKEVYNRNGRIGIYTPAERAAIIGRFNKKRQRRVWNKKIRYNCRKSLADRRLRVKGRFVKRSEQEQLAKEMIARVEQEILPDSSSVATESTAATTNTTITNALSLHPPSTLENGGERVAGIQQHSSASGKEETNIDSSTTTANNSNDKTEMMEEEKEASGEVEDEDMPDVGDTEAGFSPTDDQPYRRLRRYTIA